MLNPFDPDFARDPYPAYAVERTAEPVQATPFGPWIVFTHEESTRLLRDVTLSVDVRKAVELTGEDPRNRTRLRAA